MTRPWVVAVHRSAGHEFSKQPAPCVELLAGLGVEGDAHCGATVQHRSRVRRDPRQPNLRQVHLLPAELLAELDVDPGALGENVTTRGVELLELSGGTLLHLGPTAVVEVTGLRNPCVQIEAFRPGLLAEVLGRGPGGAVLRRTGVMGVVRRSGPVAAGDLIQVVSPAVHTPLAVV